METEDKIRIESLEAIVKNKKLKDLLKVDYEQTFEYNILRGELRNLARGTPLQLDPMTNPLKEIDNAMLGGKTFAVIQWVLTQAHADAISDYVAAWSQDSTIYKHKSTAVIFTSNIGLFNETIRRLSYTMSLEASTDEERKEVLDKVAEEVQEGWEQKYKSKIKVAVPETIVKGSRGMNLHQTQTAALKSIFSTPKRELILQPFTDAKIKILQTSNLEYVIPTIGPEMIGGYESLKKEFNDFVVEPIRDPARANKFGIGIPRGIKFIR